VGAREEEEARGSYPDTPRQNYILESKYLTASSSLPPDLLRTLPSRRPKKKSGIPEQEQERKNCGSGFFFFF
jgi:hypothetical protein